MIKAKELTLKKVHETSRGNVIDTFKPFGYSDLGILRQVGIDDCNNNTLYEGDMVEFEYYGSKERGIIHYEGCRWLIACDEVEDGYIYLSEFEINDGNYYWAENVKRIKSKYENG